MQTSKIWLAVVIVFLVLSSCIPTATPSSPEGLQVITHPDGPLFAGDQVSFEILARPNQKARDDHVEVKFAGKSLGNADFSGFGIGGRSEAVFWWAWDTAGQKPGPYTLTFTDASLELTWNETIVLHPASQIPPPEPGAHWAETITTCCVLHYITGTAAARDIAGLSQEADNQSADIATRLNYQLKSRIDVTLMPRVIGQGGFTTGSVYLSYLEDNYMANEMPILFHHEFVHYYDAQIGGGYRPSILEEGLAVYLTGGHFKPEPLRPRAAAMLNLGWYIPLTTVANDFYNQQHDIGYLEGATVVQYLVETYGWQGFNDFFRTIPAPEGRKDAAVLDAALQEKFHISFDQLEAGYLAWLKARSFTEGEKADLRLTVQFFDTTRRYQKKLDPSAYFLTAWLPDGSVMRQRGIVADFLRRPHGPVNQVLESLFIHAWDKLASGQYAGCDRILKIANWLLSLMGA